MWRFLAFTWMVGMVSIATAVPETPSVQRAIRGVLDLELEVFVEPV